VPSASPLIPVIDLFAGPGGLGEGFSSARSKGRPEFRLMLSVECDKHAYTTLRLRAFYRQFAASRRRPPKEYFRHVIGDVSHDDLWSAHACEAEAAEAEACAARLGHPADDREIDGRLRALTRAGVDLRRSVLIGGPPCQAYSLVGRARLSKAKSQGEYRDTDDGRHVLYRQYLRLLEDLTPAVFVMENVRGILSSTYAGRPIFAEILNDLASAGYDLHALGQSTSGHLFAENDPRSYLLLASDFGVPQRRARVFIIGTRRDLGLRQGTLRLHAGRGDPSGMWRSIRDLPRLRSGLSSRDSAGAWQQCIRDSASRLVMDVANVHPDVAVILKRVAQPQSRLPTARAACYHDHALVPTLLLNHETRGHIPEDLERYLFYSAWGKARRSSPTLTEIPSRILPKHENVRVAARESRLNAVAFADRFRVQVGGQPSTTITSHIAKDGHYFIHPDPMQCRSLTVREAARLQTFPDDYAFCGPRTEQYRQVGNAVPPLLARRLAHAIQSLNVW
jgi:DNA (cytosine-5)-methyltransferase 1